MDPHLNWELIVCYIWILFLCIQRVPDRYSVFPDGTTRLFEKWNERQFSAWGQLLSLLWRLIMIGAFSLSCRAARLHYRVR